MAQRKPRLYTYRRTTGSSRPVEVKDLRLLQVKERLGSLTLQDAVCRLATHSDFEYLEWMHGGTLTRIERQPEEGQ
jgi:hypothetical protein